MAEVYTIQKKGDLSGRSRRQQDVPRVDAVEHGTKALKALPNASECDLVKDPNSGGSLTALLSSRPSWRRFGVHPHERHLHHRRTDLPRVESLPRACGRPFNVGISVSRVGGNAQVKAMTTVAAPSPRPAQYAPWKRSRSSPPISDATSRQQLARGARSSRS